MTVSTQPSRVMSGKVAALTDRLRSGGLQSTARHVRTVLLHRAHDLVDRRTYGDTDATTGKHELDALEIASANKSAGVHYLPTPWRVLDWVHDALPADKSDWTFIDLGAGKGRAVISAASRPYRRVIGVEFAKELARTAEENLKSIAPFEAGSAEIKHADATEFAFPAEPTVVFMFNPFDASVMTPVAAAIARSYQGDPRPIIIAYLNPALTEIWRVTPGFEPVALPSALALRMRTLSPYALDLYATAEARALLD
jgi:16S rRNA G966 N2-methylase RsmD